MSNTPNYDAKVRAILEATTPGERACSLMGEKWMMTDEEIGWYKKFNVPPSTVAPTVRLRQLAGFAAGVSIWWKPHAVTQKPILSFIHPDNPFQVITDKEWFGNDYVNGFAWNPNQPFFDQFRTLAHSIPIGALRDDGSSVNTIGVDIADAEDSYMVFGSGEMKRVYYAYMSGMRSEDCVDVTNSGNNRESFGLDWSDGMFGCVYTFDCMTCINCAFLYSCDDCEHCFGATNQNHKQYLWFNEQLTREEWERRRAEVDLSKYSVFCEYVERFHALMAEAVWPEHSNLACEDCVGEGMIKCTRARECWWGVNSTDLFHSWACLDQQASAFTVWAGRGSETYQSVDLMNSQNCKYCIRVWRSISMEYSSDCYECQNCFGCFGLRHKQFCIFNNQYSEDEYWQKLDEIKCAMLERGEYGTFFPGDFSQSGFQFSMGKMYFDYTPEEYAAFQAPHVDPSRGAVVMPSIADPEHALHIEDIPDALDDVDPEKFVGKAIHDPVFKRNYSVAPVEFEFYKKHRLPFPRQHFLSRLKTLARHSNTPVKMATTCTTCGKAITTYKNQMFAERHVHCWPCYLQYLEIHG
ncbi:MAG: hypothetical protein AAB865_01720 [Patescibacteria group bacterium]